MPPFRRHVRLRSYVFAFTAIASFLILAHSPLLDLPFYWDELGQFIPASLDLYQAGQWIPHTTVPNVHPPGLEAYLAVIWHIFGYSIEITRIAMLLVGALGALFTFLLAIELARYTTGAPAFVAVALLCLSPLFFAQSMLAQLDMPAMCFTVLALLLFLQNRFRASAAACIILALVKETGIVVAILFGVWLVCERRVKPALWFLLPVGGLAIWLCALRHTTAHWLGNPAFTQYNVFYPLHPVRLALALLRRIYYLFIGSGHFIGTAALIWAVKRIPTLKDRAWRVTTSFAALHIFAVSVLGGAVLERYLLPVLPMLYISFAIAFRALLPQMRIIAMVALLACLIAANVINPLYPFPFENNLAFASFVRLEQQAAAAVEMSPERTIATTFPLAGALRRPEFGFVEKKLKAREIEGFGASHIANLKEDPPDFLIVYAIAWDPLHMLDVPWIRRFLRDYYGYEPPLSPGEIGEILSMHPAQRWKRGGLTMELLARGEAPKIYVRYTPVDLHYDLWSGRMHHHQTLLPRVYLDWITKRAAKSFE